MESPMQKMLPPDLYEDVVELEKAFSMEKLQAMTNSEIPTWKGFRFSPHFTPQLVQFAYDNWSLKEEDVLLASFPKTGTNWMITTLRRLLYNEEELDLVKDLPMSLTLLEAGGGKKLDILDRLPINRRIISTHMPAELINLEKIKENYAKVVCMMRNPKDQLVSWYHFSQKLFGKNQTMGEMVNNGWEKFFNIAVNGTLPGEWYPHHLLSWYKHKDHKNFYFVYYEDLKKDFNKELCNLAEFLGVEITEKQASKIEEKCSFGNMKQDISSYSNNAKMFQAANLRKGEVGDWKNYFTVAQSELVDQKIKECLGSTDVTFTYCL